MFCLRRDFCLRQFFLRQKIPKTKNPKIEYLPRTKKPRLVTDFTLVNTGGWGGHIQHNDNYCKLQSYKGTNLGYDMICESVKSDQEEKEGYVLNDSRIMHLKNLITNIDKFLV